MNALDGLKFFGLEYLDSQDTLFKDHHKKTSSLMIVNRHGEAVCEYLIELLNYDNHHLIMKLVAKTVMDKININELGMVVKLLNMYNDLVMSRQYDDEIPVLELQNDKVHIKPMYFKRAGQNMVGLFIYEKKSFIKLEDYKNSILQIEDEELRQFRVNELINLKDDILDLCGDVSFY